MFFDASASGKTAKILGSQAFPKLLLPHNLCKITLYNAQRDLPLSMSHLRKAISFLLKDLKVSTQEIIFHFVTESKICFIHKEYFNDPNSTDCISFPIDPPNKMSTVLGEAFICPKVALEYSRKHRIDPYQELLRYVVHCLLHLLGYDDLQPKERAKMKKKENSCLKKLLREGFVKPLKKPLRQRTS
jgi:probable rRNA maturation factor